MKPEMTAAKRARLASSMVAPGVCGDLDADARASRAKARRLRRKHSYAKWTQHLWSGWTGCWHGWAETYEHIKHLQQETTMPAEPLEVLLQELGPATFKKPTPFDGSQIALLKDMMGGHAACLGETVDARFEEMTTEITALKSKLCELTVKNEMFENAQTEYATLKTDVIAQLRQELLEASPQRPPSPLASPSKKVHFEPVQIERDEVVKKKPSGLAEVSKKVVNMRKGMQAANPPAQSSSWAAWSRRPSPQTDEGREVPADFGKRLKLLNDYRAENGQTAQICLLCPKIVMEGELYGDCCEFCYHEVLPLISPEQVCKSRQDQKVLLTASQCSKK